MSFSHSSVGLKKCLMIEKCKAIAQVVSRRPLTADTVPLGQVFLRVLTLSPVDIIPPWLSIYLYNLGAEQ
jgi:hypothetical protein